MSAAAPGIGPCNVTVDPALHVTLLDGFAVRSLSTGDLVSDDLPQRIQRLVAHLCISRRTARAAVAGSLWPDVTESHASGSLRSALWRLHRSVPGLVQATSRSVTLNDRVQVDLHEMTRWARRTLDTGSSLEDIALPDVDLEGDLLPDWEDDWVVMERERFDPLRVQALEIAAVRLARAGRHGEAIRVAYAAAQSEPLRESAHRTIVEVHLAQGNVAEAVRVYEMFRTVLVEELGVVPTEQMTRIVRSIASLNACAS